MARRKNVVGATGVTLPSPPKVHGRRLLHAKWIERVAETPENDVRAHRIALTYHHLARYLDELLHGERSINQTIDKPLHERRGIVRNANWFNFATWATLTVSQNIGNQQPLQRLNSGPAMLARRILTPAILSIKASRGQEVGRALAWGQLLIFNAACRAMMRLVDHLTDPSVPLSMVEEDLLVPVQHGMDISQQRAEYARFVTPLNDALRYLAEACRTDDPVAKARLILGANLRITQVEQDFADKAVSIVVDLVPRRLFDGVDWQFARLAERLREMPSHLSFLVLRSLHSTQRLGVDAVWSRFMTDQVLVMALPCETLRVGRDIPPLRRDRPYYPPDLTFPLDVEALRDGSDLGDRLVEVALLVRSLDRTVGNGRGSAARDWRRWDERLNWALTLLRTRQHDESLFWRPYSEHDEGRIVRGELPLRSGDPSALDVQPPLDPAIELRADLTLQSGEVDFFGSDARDDRDDEDAS
jgi:hypothetical protein